MEIRSTNEPRNTISLSWTKVAYLKSGVEGEGGENDVEINGSHNYVLFRSTIH